MQRCPENICGELHTLHLDGKAVIHRTAPNGQAVQGRGRVQPGGRQVFSPSLRRPDPRVRSNRPTSAIRIKSVFRGEYWVVMATVGLSHTYHTRLAITLFGALVVVNAIVTVSSKCSLPAAPFAPVTTAPGLLRPSPAHIVQHGFPRSCCCHLPSQPSHQLRTRQAHRVVRMEADLLRPDTHDQVFL